jgi:hypothetical protein
MCHIARDTDSGLVLRSRFWLGATLGLSPEETAAAIPDELGLGLMQHCHTEFKWLAKVLPSIYWGAHADAPEVPSLW